MRPYGKAPAVTGVLPMIRHPICIYDNWASYDELSDSIELTEELALRELDELLRMRAAGARFDYYLMDAFWYDPDGGYRAWRKPHWPNGPDRWLRRCLENGIKPGLWLSSNTLCKLNPIPDWEDSLDRSRGAACFFAGGFWPHLLETMDIWYQRGVRLFKFDFLDLYAGTPAVEASLLPHTEILPLNTATFTAGLKAFRGMHPEVVLLAYNGFEEHRSSRPALSEAEGFAASSGRFISTRWLESFDSVYSGDPAPSDVPAHNFFRSVDIYSNMRVQVYHANGLPLRSIDSCSFMGGPTGTCYRRNAIGWKGMLILSLARGGWVNTYHGALELYDDADATWFAKVQSMYLPLQLHGHVFAFGGEAARGDPHGFASHDGQGALFAVTNPSQSVTDLELPDPQLDCDTAGARLLFQDAGFQAQVKGGRVTLGPEQLALVGLGRYASEDYQLGEQRDILIPSSISKLTAEWQRLDEETIGATVTLPAPATLRIIAGQHHRGADLQSAAGAPRRVWATSDRNTTSLGDILRLSAEQAGRPLPIARQYDRPIWSGLSWAAGEVRAEDIAPGQPVTVRFQSKDPSKPELTCEVYLVQYARAA
jgi:hypothetical protein